MKKEIITISLCFLILILTTFPVLLIISYDNSNANELTCLTYNEIWEKAEGAAKEADIKWSRHKSVFVKSHVDNVPDFYQFFFFEGKKWIGRLRIDICGKLLGLAENYSTPKEFNDILLDGENICPYFDTTMGKTESVKSWNASLIFTDDSDDIPQPVWLVTDEDGEQWYVTIYGKVYKASVLRKAFINGMKKAIEIQEGSDEK